MDEFKSDREKSIDNFINKKKKVSFSLKLFFNEKRNWHKLLTERPFLKDHFPGYEKYIWLDADTEVLDSQGIKNLIDATKEKDLAISTEINESYVFKNTKFGIKNIFSSFYKISGWSFKNYKKYFSKDLGEDLFFKPLFNNGVFCMRSDSPFWELWKNEYQAALNRAKTSYGIKTDQLSLNKIIYQNFKKNSKVYYGVSAIALLICLGSDIILAQNSITVERLLTNPNDIIGKINNNYLTIISLMLILISSISSNLIANYIPSQNTLINFLPNSLNLKSSGAVIILLALFVSFFWLSIFSQGLSLSVFDTLASFLGPIFGVIIADFYFIQNKKINHKELFYPEETTIYIYNSGWNLKALYSVLIGFIFSASTIWNINLMFLQSLSWIIGAFVTALTYYLLAKR